MRLPMCRHDAVQPLRDGSCDSDDEIDPGPPATPMTTPSARRLSCAHRLYAHKRVAISLCYDAIHVAVAVKL